MKDLAINVWSQHINVFKHFDLVCHNGHSLEDETKCNGLFNALVTLERMLDISTGKDERNEIEGAIEYLKGSKHYSEDNADSEY